MKFDTRVVIFTAFAILLPASTLATQVSEEKVDALVERLNKQDRVTNNVGVTVQDSSSLSRVGVNWKGAPEFKSENALSFKPLGRIPSDFSNLFSIPTSISIPGKGFSTEARRERLGVRRTMPSGFGDKLEVDHAGGGKSLFRSRFVKTYLLAKY